ncbi:MAG: hypothetical protein NZ937_07630 [Armatimonadetes bacterium]|nr:hypothetical protein [Armatimonadota bacterium]
MRLLFVMVTIWLLTSPLLAQMIAPDLHSTFLQLEASNLVWTDKQWKQEFQAVKAIGMKIIIQHIAHEQKAFYRSKLFPLWADLEIFDIPSGWLPAPIDRITAQFASVRDLVERVVIFDFNHYLSPVRSGYSTRLYAQWLKRFFTKTTVVNLDERQKRLRHCASFLRSLFVTKLGLLRVHLGEKICWLANDNLLAAKALEEFEPSLAHTNPTNDEAIQRTRAQLPESTF